MIKKELGINGIVAGRALRFIHDDDAKCPGAGTLEGLASASPLLANIYLHDVFDLRADCWRKRHTRGQIILVRSADDIFMGFEQEGEVRCFLADLRRRVIVKAEHNAHGAKCRVAEFLTTLDWPPTNLGIRSTGC